ncbi:hypothetical protein ASPZODRAFT_147291 [Penicilliopsis zonata CBS 506.65]|uniref:N-acetyltransferase domain-containing protein n=1 Tax=Penicilliopsis zonata CBS 506.65 TaxID=1073090 RepID=A0A1L9S5L1_9EURO|nr:hypothetical protein ASPZODRAFT_147291 [Penicilliopsis zonata CBS 506.65]OJJ42454.1 hypothetical protein ASPZODRAFT_147291 [Penicilliopsis zonata CBS 506.65]
MSSMTLSPVDLGKDAEFHELQRQRVLCGWAYETTALQKWQQKQAEGLKQLFWILIDEEDSEGDSKTTRNTIKAGHVSLDAYTDPPDEELARADKSVLTVQAFFILEQHRGNRLGRRVMTLLEEMARSERYGHPACGTLALTTLSKRYIYDEGPDGVGVWEKVVLDRPAFSSQEWYESMGYVGWKEEPRYRTETLEGGEVLLSAVFMRKAL